MVKVSEAYGRILKGDTARVGENQGAIVGCPVLE